MTDHIPPTEEAKARRRYLVRKGVLLRRPLTGPLEVCIIPTYHCNYRCIFCALEWEAPGKKKDMPAEKIKAAISDLAELDTEQVSFTGGGEPFVYKDIDYLIAYTRERGIACSVCTNGSLIDPERVELLAGLGVHLSVSLNAATPETYTLIHPKTKPEDFDRILTNLDRFVEIATRRGGEGSFVSLNFVIMNNNYLQIPEMAQLGRKIGASQIQYRLIQPRPVHSHMFLSPEQLAEARGLVRQVEEAYADADDYSVQVMEVLRSGQGAKDGPRCVPACDSDANLFAEVRPTVPRSGPDADDLARVPCIEGYIASYIDSDGVVFPCCMRSTSITNHWMGNLNESSFREIWNSERYRAFREESAQVDVTAQSTGENSCAFCPKAKQFVYLVDEFTPGNYGYLYRGVIREMERHIKTLSEQTTRLSSQSDLGESGCRVLFVSHDIPKTITAAKPFACRVVVRNVGDQVWRNVEEAGGKAVGLGYHLLDRRGRMVRFDNNPRTYLKEDLPPGGEADLDLSVLPPEKAGKYLIELTMIQERVAWFEQKGSRTLRVPVKVV